jgi:hypothetical protein
MGQTYLADPDADGGEARTQRPPQAAARQRGSACAPTQTASGCMQRFG